MSITVLGLLIVAISMVARHHKPSPGPSSSAPARSACCAQSAPAPAMCGTSSPPKGSSSPCSLGRRQCR
jgi:hypothetical protein